ncbi:MAG: HEAT repeat domain-containing protein, partial [Planctomycetes bacterium]|nr:HEAT repeat domain-containing protein [Planctomycetota bacterium]
VPFRRAAAAALGRIGDAGAAPALAAALRDGDAEVVCLAAEALAALGSREGGRALYDALIATDDPVVADAIGRALLALYGDDPGTSATARASWARRHRLSP